MSSNKNIPLTSVTHHTHFYSVLSTALLGCTKWEKRILPPGFPKSIQRLQSLPQWGTILNFELKNKTLPYLCPCSRSKKTHTITNIKWSNFHFINRSSNEYKSARSVALFTVSERRLTESGRLKAPNAVQLFQWTFSKRLNDTKQASENVWSHNHCWPWSLSDELGPALTPPEALRGCKPIKATFIMFANSGQLGTENSKM